MAKKTEQTEETGTALTAPDQTAKAGLVTVTPQQLAEVIQANLGDGGISPYALDRVKVPAGGATVWEVPSVKGAKEAKALEGIIIYKKEVRAYWHEAYSGGSNPPDCKSDDGKHGDGDPGGECAKCPMAQFGSAPDKNSPSKRGKGQACKQALMLFVMRPESFMPTLVIVPPTSIKEAQRYFFGLVGTATRYFDCVSRLTLEKDKNADGIQYSKAKFAWVRDLNAEEKGNIATLTKAMRALFEQAAIDANDVHGSSDAA